MVRMFIDTCDENAFIQDQEGQVFRDLEAARAAAARALHEIALDANRDGHDRVCVARLRDEANRPVLQLELTFRTCLPPPPRA